MILKQVIRYTNAPCLEATWVDEKGVVIKCQAYSNHPEQIAMLRADLGTDAAQYEGMIAEVEATYVEPENVTPTADELIAAVQQAVQQRLDDFARSRAYDGILSACTYATSAVEKFASEGQYAVQVRDATWAACYQIMADVRQGQRPMPTVEQVLSELPALEWPL